jgi:hypothetical protein
MRGGSINNVLNDEVGDVAVAFSWPFDGDHADGEDCSLEPLEDRRPEDQACRTFLLFDRPIRLSALTLD